MPGKCDITPLLPWINEPYIQDRVLGVARGLPQPFMLRELVNATGLPNYVVQKRLDRLVRKGIMTRFKANLTYAGQPNVKRMQYLYSFVERSE